MKSSRHLLSLLLPAALLLGGCKTMYYGAMEKMGFAKRDLLVTRVEKARKAQNETKEQFKDALEKFRSVVSVEGGDLEKRYDTLSRVLKRSEEKAADVRERIDAIESVSDALFKEWKKELALYRNPNLRASSQVQYYKTRKQYDELIAAMNRAESKLEPVLEPLRDQVLFLKHNLNARAIASLKAELVTVEVNVTSLVRELENAIAEADAFIESMQGQ